MEIRQIVLLDTTGKVASGKLADIANALTIQVQRDFAPEWNVSAVVSASTEVLKGQWPIYVVDELDLANAWGYHYIDDNSVPYAKVLFRDVWTLTASHELLEMLVNPYLDRYQVTDISTDLPGNESFLLEVAGPVQDIAFSYRINDVLVSNFMYPSFFDLLLVEGKKYDYLGAIKKPRSILNGGYVSFIDAVGQWWQAFVIQNKVDLRRLVDGKFVGTPTYSRLLRGLAWVAGSALVFFLIFKLSKRWLTSRK